MTSEQTKVMRKKELLFISTRREMTDEELEELTSLKDIKVK